MARPVWTGSISFGLVNVPVRALSAVRDHDVHFHQLDKKSGSRVRNRKVAESTGEEVDKDDIELGFEIEKDRYVTFESEEVAELRPRSTRSIDVTDFVSLDEIDPIFYERTYWLAPDGESAAKPYGLLLAAMEDRNRAAIGTVVMRNKQYLAAVRPLDGALAMSTMRFADEVVQRADVDVPTTRAKPEPKILRMATQLIDTLASPWDPTQYHDTFAEELRRIIKAKDEGKQIVTSEPETTDAKVLDLMEALEASLRGSRSKSATTTKSAKPSKAKPSKAKPSKAKSAKPATTKAKSATSKAKSATSKAKSAKSTKPARKSA